jgi:hypothetical protein
MILSTQWVLQPLLAKSNRDMYGLQHEHGFDGSRRRVPWLALGEGDAVRERLRLIRRIYWRKKVAVTYAVIAGAASVAITLTGELASNSVQQTARLMWLFQHLPVWAWPTAGAGLLIVALIIGTGGMINELQDKDSSYEKELERARTDKATALAEQQDRHNAVLADLRRDNDLATASLQSEHRDAIALLHIELQAALADQKSKYEDALAAQEARHAAALAAEKAKGDRTRQIERQRQHEKDRPKLVGRFVPYEGNHQRRVCGVEVKILEGSPLINVVVELPADNKRISNGRSQLQSRHFGVFRAGRWIPFEGLVRLTDEEPVGTVHLIGNCLNEYGEGGTTFSSMPHLRMCICPGGRLTRRVSNQDGLLPHLPPFRLRNHKSQAR